MSDVKRYEAVHLRYEDSNIRYGEGCEVEVVAAYDYDALAKTHNEVETDRDIKAANLKTLVDMVLDYDTAADRLEDHEEGGGLDYVEIMTAYDRMVRLARGLKQ